MHSKLDQCATVEMCEPQICMRKAKEAEAATAFSPSKLRLDEAVPIFFLPSNFKQGVTRMWANILNMDGNWNYKENPDGYSYS